MRRALPCSLFWLMAACGGAEDSLEQPASLQTLRQHLALFDYKAPSSTDNDTNPDTVANSEVVLNAGEAVMIGTCSINESAFSVDTYLRLLTPSMTEVASNDDQCGGRGSKISYTPSVSGSFLLRAGCFSTGLCSGTVALSRRLGAPVAFSAASTNDAQVNTYNKQYALTGGDVVRVSTCGYSATGATASGDTYLRLYKNNGGVFTLVASNNTAASSPCGTAAEILFTVPSAGYYQVRVGCAADTACSGNLAVYVE